MVAGFLDPKNDFAFKQIFGTEKHKDILIHFLNDVLKLKEEYLIREVQFLSTVQDPEVAAKKQSIVDVLCVDEEGRQFVIEMQVARTTGFKERAFYYASKAYVSQMVKGGTYEHLKEVIFIAIIDYELFPNKKDYHSSHALCDQKTHEQDLKGIRFEFLELPRFAKRLADISTMIEKWCYFFKYAPQTTAVELEKLVGNDAVIQEAYQALDSAYWTVDELRLYEQEMKSENDELSMLRYAEQLGVEKGMKKGMKKGMQKGLEKGLEEGITVATRSIARNLLAAGFSSSVVAESTGLSVTAVEELKEAVK